MNGEIILDRRMYQVPRRRINLNTGIDTKVLREIIQKKGLSIFIGIQVNLANGISIDRGVRIGDCTIIDQATRIGHNVEIGKFCNIGLDVRIEERTIIGNKCQIGHKVKIGKDCVIGAGTTIQSGSKIPDNFRIEPGTVYLNDQPKKPIAWLVGFQGGRVALKPLYETNIAEDFKSSPKVSWDHPPAEKPFTTKTPIIEDISEDNLKEHAKAFDNLQDALHDHIASIKLNTFRPDLFNSWLKGEPGTKWQPPIMDAQKKDAPMTYQGFATIIGALLEQRKLQGTEHETEVTKKLWDILEANFPKVS